MLRNSIFQCEMYLKFTLFFIQILHNIVHLRFYFCLYIFLCKLIFIINKMPIINRPQLYILGVKYFQFSYYFNFNRFIIFFFIDHKLAVISCSWRERLVQNTCCICVKDLLLKIRVQAKNPSGNQQHTCTQSVSAVQSIRPRHTKPNFIVYLSLRLNMNIEHYLLFHIHNIK